MLGFVELVCVGLNLDGYLELSFFFLLFMKWG